MSKTILKHERVRRGLSQHAFADLIGFNQSNISEYENGIRPVGLIRARQIAAILGIERSQFLDCEGFALAMPTAVQELLSHE
jgi:transcriptional regulator with XRE-family HTH domain